MTTQNIKQNLFYVRRKNQPMVPLIFWVRSGKSLLFTYEKLNQQFPSFSVFFMYGTVNECSHNYIIFADLESLWDNTDIILVAV